MCLEVTYGSDSNRAAPDNCPEWAIEFSVDTDIFVVILI